MLSPKYPIYLLRLNNTPITHHGIHLFLPFPSWEIYEKSKRKKKPWRKIEKEITLCIESIFSGLQYWRVWGSSLCDQMAETEAWHPCVTTLPIGHVSIRSLLNTTYCTTTSSEFPAFFSSFCGLGSKSVVDWLMELDASWVSDRVVTRKGKERSRALILDLEGVRWRREGVKRRGERRVAIEW